MFYYRTLIVSYVCGTSSNSSGTLLKVHLPASKWWINHLQYTSTRNTHALFVSYIICNMLLLQMTIARMVLVAECRYIIIWYTVFIITVARCANKWQKCHLLEIFTIYSWSFSAPVHSSISLTNMCGFISFWPYLMWIVWILLVHINYGKFIPNRAEY